MSYKPSLLLTALLLLVVACVPTAVEPGLPTVAPVAYPPPVPTISPSTPSPAPTLIEIEPGTFAEPTMTPAPLFTPLPSPTRRPGPTPTAVPLTQPPDNPAGIIRYATLSEPPSQGVYTHYAITIDAEGMAAREAEIIPLPDELETNIFQVHPSPNGRYSVLMWSSMPGGIPYVYNHATGKVGSPYPESYPGGRFFWLASG